MIALHILQGESLARHWRPLLARIHQIDWAGRTEGRRNAADNADSFFHPSGPSRPGYLTQRKSLISRPELARGGGRTPFHPGNPGLG
jgi:hypothetical protein